MVDQAVLDRKYEQVDKLVRKFESHYEQYIKASYNEDNTRADFIDPLFRILGWDVGNKKGYAEQYRDVVREDKIRIRENLKAPDYSFRLAGVRKFFVEAKKPSVNIKEAKEPAFQLRRYGYTAKLPLSILTDFQEFAIYDTRIKPDKDDKAGTARDFYCRYDELLKNYNQETYFSFLYNTFSREAILKGSFDRYVEQNKDKRGTSEVDKEFLKLIEQWRTEIAKNLALRNNDLGLRDLNYAVQKIIDRIIFLRIAEDRQMEAYGQLLEAGQEKEIYKRLTKVFHNANEKYNSGLFKSETWLDKLYIDDKIFKSIFNGLYYPNCPYEFSVMPIELLGNVYEQFIGKTIFLTPSHQAKIEEKPEVRKAGGIYYTPQYIVDYIVENTVGEKLKKRNPEKVESLRIVDPACGSGSFLVGAYAKLLTWHLDYYTKDEKSINSAMKKKKIYESSDRDYRLCIDEKQRILLNNIYGVDIDSQAVEVTKLSLLLKLLEDENIQAEEELFKHTDLKLLPDLSSNIKCGNSLIGSDFYNDKDISILGDDEIGKVNAFDWEKEFPQVFADEGFEIVIGNPPYIKIQVLKEYQPETVEYMNKKFFSSGNGSYDIYIIFIEKGFCLLSKSGILGFIMPHKFMNSKYGELIRQFLSERKALKEVIHFGDNQIFEGVSTYTGLFFLSNEKNESFIFNKVANCSRSQYFIHHSRVNLTRKN